MYLLRDDHVKAPNRAIRRARSASRQATLAWAVLLTAGMALRAHAPAAQTLTPPATPPPSARANPASTPGPACAAGTWAYAATARSRRSSQANPASVGGQCPPLPTPPGGPVVTCRYDAALTRIFTPRAAPAGSYRAWVTSSALEKVAGLLRTASNAAGGWTVQQMDPLDAFGTAGDYDQVAVARLYVGRRAAVARGPVLDNGRVAAAVWLISPYPDPALTHLEQGTLIIEFRVDRVGK